MLAHGRAGGADYSGAAMAYCRLEDSFRNSRKFTRLAKALGISAPHARGLVAGLWSWAVTQAPDGDLCDHDPDEIEAGADWGGEEGALVSAMADPRVGLLDETSSGYRLHGYLQRSESYQVAQRKAKSRVTKSATCADNVTDTAVTRPSRVDANVTPMSQGEREKRETKEKRERDPEVATVKAHFVGVYPDKAIQADTPQTLRLIRKWLAIGYTPEQLCLAIDGNLASEWHQQKRMTGMGQILKSAEVIDRFIDAAKPKRSRPLTVNAPRLDGPT